MKSQREGRRVRLRGDVTTESEGDLKMEEGAMGMGPWDQAASGSWERRGSRSPSALPGRTHLDFRTSRPQDNKFLFL